MPFVFTLLFLALFCGALVPGAARAANVSGLIRDTESREPVGFVTVQVIGNDAAGARVARGIMALSDGRYFLAGIPVGRFVLSYTRIGYTTVEDTLVVVDTDSTYNRDIFMTVEPVPVQEIIVQGDRYQGIRDVQPGFISINADSLSRLPGIIESDVIRSLVLLPGVSAASDFSSGLYVRGGGPDQTLVQLDRVTVYNPSHAFGFFSSFNADALGDINLYKGAYPADSGGRLGALLDVTSRDGNNEALHGRVGISTIAARATLDGPVGDGGWMLSGRRTYLEPILNAIRDEDTEVPDYYFYDLNGRLTYPALGGKFEATAYTGRDDMAFVFDADNQLFFEWGNTVGSLAYSRTLSPSVLLKTQLSGSYYASDSGVRALTTPIKFSNQITDVTLRADATWQPSAAHVVTGGALATQYDVRYNDEFNGEAGIDYRREPFEFAAYVEDEWLVRMGTRVQAGLRTRYVDEGDRVLWEPRLNASQVVADRWRIKAGGGIYHQFMQLVSTEGFSAADFYVPLDESTLPGRSWQVILGGEYNPTAGYFFSIEGYYTGLDHLVTIDNRQPAGTEVDQADDVFLSGGDGYATGVELYARKERGAVTGWIGYTLGWTERQWDEINQGDAFPPKYDRRHDLSIVGEYRRGRWRYGGAFVYGTGQAFTPASSRYIVRNPATGTFLDDPLVLAADKNSARLLSYSRLDVSVTREFGLFGNDAEVYLQIFNLYNRENEWFVQYDNTEGGLLDPSVVHMLPLIPSLGVNFRF